MTRFLAILMMLTLLVGHSSSVTAAICLHQNAHAHAAALQSSDASVAAIPLAEETAAAVSEKEGQSPGNSIPWPGDLLPATLPIVPLHSADIMRPRPAAQVALASASIGPLLEPPPA